MLRVREYCKKDLALFQSWWDQTSRSYIDRPTEVWSNYVTQNSNVRLDCLENEDVFSYIQLDRELEVGYICVVTNPKFHRKGYGTKLLQQLYSAYLDFGISILKGFVDPDNISSLEFFEKNGFKAVSEDKDFICYQKRIQQSD